MGMSSPTFEDRAFNRDERVVVQRSEHRSIASISGDRPPDDPLRPTLNYLAEHAPASKQLEPIARALVRATYGHKYDDLNMRRSSLVMKQHQKGLSPAESSKLDYLTWQIEQIEEAMVGDYWASIQTALSHRASLAREMHEFIAQLKNVAPSAFRSRNGRR